MSVQLSSIFKCIDECLLRIENPQVSGTTITKEIVTRPPFLSEDIPGSLRDSQEGRSVGNQFVLGSRDCGYGRADPTRVDHLFRILGRAVVQQPDPVSQPNPRSLERDRRPAEAAIEPDSESGGERPRIRQA